MENLSQGITLSLMGMAITFLALGLLVVLMIVLREAFAPRRQGTSQPAADDDPAAVAAAVAVAILRQKHRTTDASLGEALRSEPNSWWLLNVPWRQNGN